MGGLNAQSGGRDEDGAQVLRFDPRNVTWKLLHDSPLVQGLDERMRARDRSVRAMLVHQTKSDREPALYLGVGSLERQVVFLRSIDGETFEECEEHGLGLGDADIPSVRAMCGLRRRIYTSPTGKNYDRGLLDDNMTDYPIVFETDDPLRGHWRPVSEPGFGDKNNVSVNELVVFNSHVYAATHNPRRGYQVWKTNTRGQPPYRWKKILEDGAYRGPASSVPSSMFVSHDALYIGGALQRQGRNSPDWSGRPHDRYGPFAAELIRVYPDDTWDLIAGTPRLTPHGLKRPLSSMACGFDDLFTQVFWCMAEYDGWLYVGTAGWRWMPTYLRNRPDLSESRLRYLKEKTDNHIGGEFAIWRTRDGINWVPVTTTGFGGNPNDMGVREMIGTPYGLFVAPACKYGARQEGGLEIWWGSEDFHSEGG
jgi:hypothetical protein